MLKASCFFAVRKQCLINLWQLRGILFVFKELVFKELEMIYFGEKAE